MPSIIEGYNYDIFISYRQKDNKHDGWVTEFVDNLKGELESTFKEEISVYFDINPHDGLLETHDVNASLKEKLKCLIFIPIISRTYCDPKSFAWEHEFNAFVELASHDQFGLKAKLPNGNVASRVLPVRIHDLDNDDIKLCESILGGVLRGVEFIYKEPGVNKPLALEDDERKNSNSTKYKIQINKVANAVKEIITGLTAEPVVPVKESTQRKELLEDVYKKEKQTKKSKRPFKPGKRSVLSGVTILTIVIVAALLANPEIFKRDKLEKLRSSDGRISIAIMPFTNMTSDTLWNDWQDGIQELLITFLANYQEFKVKPRESVTSILQSKGLTNYASITPSIARTISQKLDANTFIYGSIIQSGSIVRINAQLIDSKTEEVYKPFQINGSAETVIPNIDALSIMIKDFLIVSKLKNEAPRSFKNYTLTNSPEAFMLFNDANNAFSNLDYSAASDLYMKALDRDSNFMLAMLRLSIAYGNLGLFDKAKEWSRKVYQNIDQMPAEEKYYANYIHTRYFGTPYESIIYLKKLQELDDQIPFMHYNLGVIYNSLHQYDKAIPEFEKSLEIYNKWDSKPSWVYNYTYLGFAYHKTGQYKKERELYEKAEFDFPENINIIHRQTILSLTEGDTAKPNKYIEEYVSARKEKGSSEADIITSLAGIYSGTNILYKAERYYRQALSLEPKSLPRMTNLAWFLIDKDRNIDEGLELIDKALELSPDNYSYLGFKGWGLYKQGKFEEALGILQKSWDMRLERAVYDHEAYLHLEAAKKAVAGQSNN